VLTIEVVEDLTSAGLPLPWSGFLSVWSAGIVKSVKMKVIERSETVRSSRLSSSEAVESSSTHHKINFQPTCIKQVS